jgi:hypothetical protein
MTKVCIVGAGVAIVLAASAAARAEPLPTQRFLPLSVAIEAAGAALKIASIRATTSRSR